jgi:hypothetical protein
MKRSTCLIGALLVAAGCFEPTDDEAPGFDPAVPPPEITEELRAQIAEEGEDAIFEIEATGEGPITYRWYCFTYDPAYPFALELVPGAADPVYIVSATSLSDDLLGLVCVATGPGGEAWSKPAILRVMTDDDDHED